jgi:leader peptidase (prepilin peptidase)/N-methyltransferase
MVDRMNAGKDWVKGRSSCDNCKHILQPVDLVPLFSWLSQKGKCRYCYKKLSLSYPLVELTTGFAFLASWLFLPYNLTGSGVILLALWLIGTVVMMGLAVFDFRWYLLPNKLVYPLIALAGLHRIVEMSSSQDALWRSLVSTLLALLVSAGVFWILHVSSKGKWIGDGDVRLAVAMALFLGGPAEVWLAIFVASVSGVIISLPQIKKSKKALKMKLPFGPLLLFGLYFSYLFGSSIIDWYSRTFLYL